MSHKKNRRHSQEIISAPGPLTIGNRTLLVSAPTPADLFTMRKWIFANAERILQSSQPVGLQQADLDRLDPEAQQTLLREFAMARSRKRELSADELFDVTTSPEGAAMMVWLATRKHDRSIRLEEIQALIDASNVDQVLADFDTATGVQVEDQIDPKALGASSS
ncbi:hypothetical protein [Tuwongella immobilis]|uniref:Uncharacterized protein n=1 Tax=Tuwongella immobilis TaxID=692036 RepID=A0A6C2YPW6_9BACT|nr:hypothetical protein [Tuwongella immobilis]VIP03065.1 unnamed protein product [Tuwongella immobilis]VTS03282.1 unnamed protein product [Tuwongella immobilis]